MLNQDRVYELEEIFKVISYRGMYKGRELIFSYEYQEFNPQPEASVVRYGDTLANDISEELMGELIEAIEGIEDFGEATLL